MAGICLSRSVAASARLRGVSYSFFRSEKMPFEHSPM
jgi:hypothetical protein